LLGIATAFPWLLGPCLHFLQKLRGTRCAQCPIRFTPERTIKRGAEQLIVNSGEPLVAVGGRPGLKDQMRYCCDVMREEMKAGDVVVDDPENGEGAGLTICYFLADTRIFVKRPTG
jgi:hypothetical protein